MEDLIFNYKPDTQIHYRFKKSTYDCEHLLIVMSGFNLPDPTVYDFTMLGHCRSSILWIKDDFDSLPAYYLCKNMKFDIEQGVSALISGVIKFAKPKYTSILGASKGGSMSLYYGVKHNIKNIITCVPQFSIGRYVAEGAWQHVGQAMMGNIHPLNIKILDNYISKQIKTDKDTNKNIYLFTSPQDIQFNSEIKPHLDLLSKYRNFNLIESSSSYVTQHTEVTRYNINLILSLIYQFEDGIFPCWGNIKNGSQW
ncbi:hypothetical protein [Hafnia alvei]|uniref:Esterase n=1 Tax=Hafnia alvei TaxID=569 RepID=A0A1C6YV68_HAFAL|nr:hypothetical protein [Hafnia alvei]NLS54578.1 hypothetical protein [Hafnia alvei]SCM50734.1 hypothetical protein BN1044_00182 [Hafnia alvei]